MLPDPPSPPRREYRVRDSLNTLKVTAASADEALRLARRSRPWLSVAAVVDGRCLALTRGGFQCASHTVGEKPYCRVHEKMWRSRVGLGAHA